MRNYSKEELDDLKEKLYYIPDFIENNTKLYKLEKENGDLRTEVIHSRQVIMSLMHNQEEMKKILNELSEKLRLFEIYIKSGEKLEKLEDDFK